MQYLQLKVAFLYCNQIIAGITIFWLKQLKVADIASINCTSVALWLQIFAVCYSTSPPMLHTTLSFVKNRVFCHFENVHNFEFIVELAEISLP